MSRPLLYCLHGWGLDASIFEPLAAALPEFDFICPDRGFFHSELATPPTWPCIGLGHSLGFLDLLALTERLRGLVSLSGFSRFIRGPHHPAGVAPALLARLRRRFAHDAAVTLAEFYALCAAPPGFRPPDPRQADHERLLQGLDLLAEADRSPELTRLELPVLALYAADDRVVPAELSRTTFTGRTVERVERPDGGHFLAQTRPDWVANQLRNFVRRHVL